MVAQVGWVAVATDSTNWEVKVTLMVGGVALVAVFRTSAAGWAFGAED